MGVLNICFDIVYRYVLTLSIFKIFGGIGYSLSGGLVNAYSFFLELANK
jgi:hypothetical protein